MSTDHQGGTQGAPGLNSSPNDAGAQKGSNGSNLKQYNILAALGIKSQAPNSGGLALSVVIQNDQMEDSDPMDTLQPLPGQENEASPPLQKVKESKPEQQRDGNAWIRGCLGLINSYAKDRRAPYKNNQQHPKT